MLKDILAYVGGVAAFLTLLVGITLAICRIFATKWIENRFSERLEAFRHEQAKEMEHLRFRINAQLDRMNKLHQQEFEVLPEFWALANKSYARTSAIASGLGMYPDLERMTEAEFLEKTESTSLDTWQKENLKSADIRDRNNIYRKYSDDLALQSAADAHRDFHNFSISNIIFVRKDVSEKMIHLEKMIFSVLLSEQLAGVERRRLAETSPYEVLLTEGQALLTEIGTLIHDRLWTRESLGADSLTESG